MGIPSRTEDTHTSYASSLLSENIPLHNLWAQSEAAVRSIFWGVLVTPDKLIALPKLWPEAAAAAAETVKEFFTTQICCVTY